MKKALIVMDNGQEITLELYDEYAPNTVLNFENLVNQKFYDGLTFHRVIPGFVSQGGCPRGDGTGSSKPIKDELIGNPLTHQAGSLSMAHRGPNTGSCQFFICHLPQPHLDGVHTVFGKVVENLDAVLKMKNGDKIKKIVMIEK